MDTTINPVSGTSQAYVAPAVKAAATPAPSSAPTIPAAVTPAASTTATVTTVQSDKEQYETAQRQAALSFKNTYAVSDQDFSIFKDATGKYITRYVSLRDGKVTYTPDPTLVRQLQLGSTSRVAINA